VTETAPPFDPGAATVAAAALIAWARRYSAIHGVHIATLAEAMAITGWHLLVDEHATAAYRAFIAGRMREIADDVEANRPIGPIGTA
jgi:hypothetical protein